jgi:hypothetical protein
MVRPSMRNQGCEQSIEGEDRKHSIEIINNSIKDQTSKTLLYTYASLYKKTINMVTNIEDLKWRIESL